MRVPRLQRARKRRKKAAAVEVVIGKVEVVAEINEAEVAVVIKGEKMVKIMDEVAIAGIAAVVEVGIALGTGKGNDADLLPDLEGAVVLEKDLVEEVSALSGLKDCQK